MTERIPAGTRTPSLPRLIASDMDGTFLLPNGGISEINAAAVRAAEQRGIPLVFATGRPIRWLGALAGLTGLHPIVIASNGAMRYDAAADEIRALVAIDVAVAGEVAAELRAELPEVRFAVEFGRRFGHESGYQTWEDASGSPDIFTADLAELLAADDPIVKLLVSSGSRSCDDLALAAAGIIGDRLTVTHSAFDDTGLLEVSGPGVSKASMLAEYCLELGIDAVDVAAFGDMPNDLEMLTWAGRPHVMTNAHPSLRRLKATEAGGNADSGVGRTILSWFDLPTESA